MTWPFLPVVLWTDALFLGLLLAVFAFLLQARRKEHLRAPWRHVIRSRLGAGALVILVFYVAIALLDSLHFRVPLSQVESSQGRVDYGVEVFSVLDRLLHHLRAQEEESYSAPFATHLYTKETVERPDGTRVQVYPRLQYGGDHLENPAEERGRDILLTSLEGAGKGALIWAVPSLLLIARLARRQGVSYRRQWLTLIQGRSKIPWHMILLTSGVVVILAAGAIELSFKYHILGTNKVGQDVFYQTLKSVRTGLIIGTVTTLVMFPFAVFLGVIAGYAGGVIDDIVQYLYTTLSSIPGVLLIAAAILSLQVYMSTHAEQFDSLAERADLRLLFLCIILGVTSWVTLCRLLRGETMKLAQMDYVQAAIALGSSRVKILGRHILPNVMHIVLINIVLDFSNLVLAEAVLSYVGVGVDPSTNSWGNMINSARLELARDPMVWWPLLAAFSLMFVLVLSANLFADVVRDAFDPKLREG